MFQASDLLLFYCKLCTLVCYRAGPDGLFDGVVFIRVPQYGPDNGDFCNRGGFLLQTNINHWVRNGVSPPSDVYICLLHDGPRHCASPNPLAAERRR